MAELRYRVLRLMDERENAGTAGTPTIGDVAEALGVSLREVSLVLKSSETMGLVTIRRYVGATEKDFAVTLKTPAFTYLESHQKSEADR
jgi:Mn-dependent DtxR family transcriptional regulator